MTNRYLVSRSRFIAAAPEAIFEVLATPALHSVIDGSDTVKGAQPRGPERLALGAKFGMDMKLLLDYKILNTVCEFEEGRRIAWRHFGGHVWRYLLEPANDSAGNPGTLVTEQWDARDVRARMLLRLAGYVRRHPASIEQTLAKLDLHVTSDAASGTAGTAADHQH
ncbi:hypothetical protein J2X01_003805 [Arthrobacter ginsengisoli]|uniref:Polyketide cyclase / dehydrase and lipid transport n=1 Tax=Arthrobacter ginsengisoli TaxID=1356565 RepID=A0ABU1UH28_9MICC|nr:polyketide cyclase / dehydrase and lipid transport [Arthrobacter ginsengisoli]MDR7084494.1 hypothetical protein [Arthrobacter ginsengisoli]